MKNLLKAVCLPVFSLLFFGAAQAQNVNFKSSAESVSGEVIDLNIYMREGGHGPAVQHWAQDGISHGDPVALLSDDGRVIILLPNMMRSDAYMQIRRIPGQHVSVTGQIYLRRNFTGMDVQSFDQLLR